MPTLVELAKYSLSRIASQHRFLSGLLLPFECDQQALPPIAERTDDGLQRNTRHTLYLAEVFKHDPQRDFGFQMGKGSTKTEVNA